MFGEKFNKGSEEGLLSTSMLEKLVNAHFVREENELLSLFSGIRDGEALKKKIIDDHQRILYKFHLLRSILINKRSANIQQPIDRLRTDLQEHLSNECNLVFWWAEIKLSRLWQ